MTEFQKAYERGVVLFDQRRHELAANEFRAALALDPNSAEAHAMLSVCLSEDGDVQAGVEEAEEAIRVAPDLAYAHYALAGALSDLARFETPKAAWDLPIKIERIQPNWASVKAFRAIEEALRLDPTNPDYLSRSAYLNVWSWKWTDALAVAERGLSIQPNHVGCIHARILALTGLGRNAEAQSGLKHFAECHPNHSVVHQLAGLFKAHDNQPGAAQEHLLESLRIEPNSIATQRALGRARSIEVLRGRNPSPPRPTDDVPNLQPAVHRKFPAWVKAVIVATLLLVVIVLLFKLQFIALSFRK